MVLLLIGFFVCERAISQDTIVWDSATMLTWGDFLGKVDSSSPYSASTVSGIVYKFRLSSEGYSDSITAVFYRSESWVSVQKDAAALVHEQGHFDITEIYARTLRKRLREFVPGRGSLGKQLKQLYDAVEVERVATETLYDTETEHSADRKQQANWNERIREELKALEEFRD
jgi:hypothetical protein